MSVSIWVLMAGYAVWLVADLRRSARPRPARCDFSSALFQAELSWTRKEMRHRLKEGFSPGEISDQMKLPVVIVENEARILEARR